MPISYLFSTSERVYSCLLFFKVEAVTVFFWKKELQETHLQKDSLYLRLTLKDLVKVAL